MKLAKNEKEKKRKEMDVESSMRNRDFHCEKLANNVHYSHLLARLDQFNEAKMNLFDCDTLCVA